MPLTIRSIPTTVKEVAVSVAADLNTLGHYQPGNGVKFDPTGHDGSGCCLAASRTWWEMVVVGKSDLYKEFMTAFQEHVGENIVTYSDTTPTAEVVEKLLSL